MDSVFVIGLVEFWFPLNWAIKQNGNDEEEREIVLCCGDKSKETFVFNKLFSRS